MRRLYFLPLLILPYLSAAAFTGSDACRNCHVDEYQQWQGSHHDLAMQEPTPDTVLGDFDDTSFEYNGVTTTFFRRDGRFLVRTDGEDGKLAEFPVQFVFGVYPLQQYLLPLSRGRLQALSIAWDARPAAGGGQRWFHLYPDEGVDHNDPLHWTGPYQNWNTRCAECHSTNLQKNYDRAERSFSTTFDDIDVGCEACHGPGETHIERAQSGELQQGSGFPTGLAQRGEWHFAAGEPIASRRQALDSMAQVDSCGRCHARRSTLGDYHYGKPLLDTHRLSLPQPPLYHIDGQILDEVYVYGSFLQSRMHQAGVVCSNCHNPHSLALHATDNGVCAQCHAAASYDTGAHHHHPPGSAGALCVNCHMPETTYMVVDPRRDHSMRVPRPDLSRLLGTPNACNGCHMEQDVQWAEKTVTDWGVTPPEPAGDLAVILQRAALGDRNAVPQLAALATSDDTANIWRATAMEALGQYGGRDAVQSASQLLYADDPLLRVSTINAIEFVSLPQRLQLLAPLFDDEVTAVRMAVASSLAPVPLDRIPAAQADDLRRLFDEYQGILSQHTDMPGSLMQLGLFHSRRGDAPTAEKAYREALALNQQMIPAYLNLADLLRTQSRDDEARDLLLTALQQAPGNGDALHALGLLETRAGNSAEALEYLRQAAMQERGNGRHRYVYAIALHDLGKPRQAIQQLQALLQEQPASEEVLLALANYNAELGRREKARYYAEALVRIAPRNRHYTELYRSLAQP